MAKISALLLVALLFLLVACQDKVDQKQAAAPGLPAKEALPAFKPTYTGASAEDRIKNTILRYNELIAYGYRNLDMNPLQEVASIDLAEKAYTHMAAIGEGNARMISQLKKIEFDPVAFATKEKARVNTREYWDFVYSDIKTGAKKGERKDFLYLVSYTLELQKGAWTITDIAASSNEKDHAPAAPRRVTPPAKSQAEPAQGAGLPPRHSQKQGSESEF